MHTRAEARGVALSMIDAAVIKGMLLRGDRRHDIAAWFGVNSGRIAEIVKGAYFAEVIEALADQLLPAGPYPKVREAVAAVDALSAIKKALTDLEATIRRLAA